MTATGELALRPVLSEEMFAEDHDPEPGLGEATVDGLAETVTALALDGRVLRLQETPAPIHAAVSPTAKGALDRLVGVGPHFNSVEEFQKELTAS